MVTHEILGVLALLHDLSDAELEAFTPAEHLALAAELGFPVPPAVRLALLEGRVATLEAAAGRA